MNVNWLLQTDVFDENIDGLAKEILNQGHNFKTIQYKPFEKSPQYYHDLYQEDDCVIFYGSIELANKINKNTRWVPGAFNSLDNYRCQNYYPFLGKWLLADKYLMLPFGDLRRQKDFIYSTFGIDDTIFIRPNSGGKVFTGQTIYLANFDYELRFLERYSVYSDTLCVVSCPRNLEKEWRFVAVQDKIVAGSLYKINLELETSPNYDAKAFSLAEEVLASGFSPDLAWTIDICLTKEGEYRLLEIGSFSCSGLYDCNKEAVIREVSTAALYEWNSYKV